MGIEQSSRGKDRHSKAVSSFGGLDVWCGWRGSNPRPLASEAKNSTISKASIHAGFSRLYVNYFPFGDDLGTVGI